MQKHESGMIFNKTKGFDLTGRQPLDSRVRVPTMNRFSSIYHLIIVVISIFLVANSSIMMFEDPLVLAYLGFAGVLAILQMLGILLVLKWFLFIEYFYILLLGYIYPNLIFLEYLYIPAVLIGMVVCFPKKCSIILVVAFGMIGSIFLSSNFINHKMFIINGIDLPVSFIAGWYYLNIALLLILFNVFSIRLRAKDEYIKEVLDQNKRMNVVNRNISERLYSIQKDSSIAERMRIVKEIHDTVGYILVNIIMLLQAALAIIGKDREVAEEKVNDALEYTRRGMNEIRHILREMRAYEKPSLGLQNKLHEIAHLFSRATGIVVKLSYGNWKKTYGNKLDNFFVSFLQESFTNALKHGCATAVDMSCWKRKLISSLMSRITEKAVRKTFNMV